MARSASVKWLYSSSSVIGLGPTTDIPFVKTKTHFPAVQGEFFANRRMPVPKSSLENRGLKPISQAAENRILDAFSHPEITRIKTPNAFPLTTLPNGTFHASIPGHHEDAEGGD